MGAGGTEAKVRYGACAMAVGLCVPVTGPTRPWAGDPASSQAHKVEAS
jgi:hypothetical protein